MGHKAKRYTWATAMFLQNWQNKDSKSTENVLLPQILFLQWLQALYRADESFLSVAILALFVFLDMYPSQCWTYFISLLGLFTWALLIPFCTLCLRNFFSTLLVICLCFWNLFSHFVFDYSLLSHLDSHQFF